MAPAKFIRRIAIVALTSIIVAAGGALTAVVPTAAAAESVMGTQVAHPAGPGLLLIAAAADTSQSFRWLDWPLQKRRLLVWDDGVLSVPDTLADLRIGRDGVAFPYLARLAGVSEGRQLVFDAGSYTIAEPLLLSDGVLQAYLSRGEITIESGRIVYRLAAEEDQDPRANYVFLAAIVLLSVILLARARTRVKRQ